MRRGVRRELETLPEVDNAFIEAKKDEIRLDNAKIIRIPGDKKGKYKFYCTHCNSFFDPYQYSNSFELSACRKLTLKEDVKCANCGFESQLIGIRNKIQDVEKYETVAEKNDHNELVLRLVGFWATFDKESLEWKFNVANDIIRANMDNAVYIKRYLTNYFGCEKITLWHDEWSNTKTYPGKFKFDLEPVKKVIKGTKFEYSMLDEFETMKLEMFVDGNFEYLERFNVNPFLEILVKRGFDKLVREFITNDVSISKRFYKQLKKNDIKWILKQDKDISLRYIYMRKLIGCDDLNVIKKACLCRMTPVFIKANGIKLPSQVKRMVEYLEKQNKSCDFYADYKRFCEESGTTFIKYPKDLKKAHDDVYKSYEIDRSEIESKKIKEYSEQLLKFKYSENSYIIIPASSTSDLIKESDRLNHCVKTYAKSYANKDTAIFFIRRKDDKETPLYTLELRGNHVIQCRGVNNSAPSEEAKDFVNHWCDKFKFKTCFI